MFKPFNQYLSYRLIYPTACHNNANNNNKAHCDIKRWCHIIFVLLLFVMIETKYRTLLITSASDSSHFRYALSMNPVVSFGCCIFEPPKNLNIRSCRRSILALAFSISISFLCFLMAPKKPSNRYNFHTLPFHRQTNTTLSVFFSTEKSLHCQYSVHSGNDFPIVCSKWCASPSYFATTLYDGVEMRHEKKTEHIKNLFSERL